MKVQELVVLGVTDSGAPFRPSDWADRLCGVVKIFGQEQRTGCAAYVTPMVASHMTCLLIDMRLQTSNPAAFEFLMNFARSNSLQMRNGREEARLDPVRSRDSVLSTGMPVGAVDRTGETVL